MMLKMMMMMMMMIFICTRFYFIQAAATPTTATSTAHVDDECRRDCRHLFNLIDIDQDGLINETDISSFLASNKCGMIPKENRDRFKEVIIRRIHRNGALNLDGFIFYLNDDFRGASEQDAILLNKQIKNVKRLFPGKTRVTREEIKAYNTGIDVGNFQESYTIGEFAAILLLRRRSFVEDYYNHDD